MIEQQQQNNYIPLQVPLKITEHVWPEGTVPLVSIRCITYNHVNFIQDAIEGFLMQETRFPVEILIHDDASNDGTADKVREYEKKYPWLIKAICQTENQYSKGNKPGAFLRSLTGGEYVAACEGDDCWISKDKLQSQMEKILQDKKCVFVGGRVKIVYESPVCREVIDPPINIDLESNDIKLFESGLWLHTASRIWKKSFLEEYQQKVRKIKYKSDLGQILYLKSQIMEGRVSALSVNETVSIYRIHAGGVWSHLSESQKLIQNIKYYLNYRNFYSSGNMHFIDDNILSSISHISRNNIKISWVDFVGIVSIMVKSGFFLKKLKISRTQLLIELRKFLKCIAWRNQ